MTGRERFLLALQHEEPDHIPIHDTLWEHTIARWRGEGLPADQSPDAYFGYDMAPQGPDVSLQLPARTIEETDTYIIRTDANGATQRVFRDHESTPELIDHTITSPERWERHRTRLTWNDTRVDWDNALAANQALHQQGKFVPYFAHIGYDWLQRIVGPERMLVAMADEPAWVQDMMRTLMDLVIRGCEEMLARGFVFDGAFIANDMSYCNGTLFSPAMFRQYEYPEQKRMHDYFRSRGLPVILHSCGNVREFIPLLLEAGLTCLQPLEVKAGMDLVTLKRQYGDRLAFMGGIDVRAMAHLDPAVIEHEIATKLTVAKQGGGYIYHSDHSVPSNVSFVQYQRVIELVHHYGRSEGGRG